MDSDYRDLLLVQGVAVVVDVVFVMGYEGCNLLMSNPSDVHEHLSTVLLR